MSCIHSRRQFKIARALAPIPYELAGYRRGCKSFLTATCHLEYICRDGPPLSTALSTLILKLQKWFSGIKSRQHKIKLKEVEEVHHLCWHLSHVTVCFQNKLGTKKKALSPVKDLLWSQQPRDSMIKGWKCFSRCAFCSRMAWVSSEMEDPASQAVILVHHLGTTHARTVLLFIFFLILPDLDSPELPWSPPPSRSSLPQ